MLADRMRMSEGSKPTIVAVGREGFVTTSLDGGTTWYNQNITTSYHNLQCIAWNGNYFLAGSSSGHIYKSADGIKWEFLADLYTRNWQSIIWAENAQQWLIVGTYYNGIETVGSLAYSTDGVNWTYTSNSHSSTFRPTSAFYRDGLTIVVGEYRNIRTSTDGGITYTTRESSATSQTPAFNSIAYTNGIYVVGSGSTEYRTSITGTSFSSRTFSASSIGYGLCASPTRFVFGRNGGIIYYSSDGINWSSISTGNLRLGYYSICWSDKLNSFFSTGTAYYSNEILIAKSEDGLIWTNTTTNGYYTNNLLAITTTG